MFSQYDNHGQLYINPTRIQNQRVKARAHDKNGHIYDYKQFSKSSVKYFTDALFGMMPQCTDIVDTIQLMTFLLFDGQADVGQFSSVQVVDFNDLIKVSSLNSKLNYWKMFGINFKGKLVRVGPWF